MVAARMTLPAGIHDIPAEVYHADALRPEVTLSSTVARLIINRSPLHAWTAHPRLNPDHDPTERKTFDIGRAAHRAVLGKGGDYVAYPSEILASNGAASTKEAKAWARKQRASGRVPLKADECDQVGAIADAVNRRLTDMGITLDPARSELTALAEVDGVWCRAMIDTAPLNPRLPLYDFKTTEDASFEAIVRSVMTYGYDAQAAFYQSTWKAATGEDRRFRFVFVEKAPPYEVAVIELLDASADVADWMGNARSKAQEARRIWGECLVANQWPGYPAKVGIIGAPGWHNDRWASREIGLPVIPTKPTGEALSAAAKWQAP